MATKIGTIIDEKYEILKQIGKGGMSFVYLAMDNRLNKQWAIKEIRKTANGENDEIIINSLLAEANLMKKLDHPALPRIVDIIDNGETIYVIMDYIEGESLDKILKNYGPQSEELVISWAMQICDALGYLHSQKPPIIYRDMKPGNVMLKPEGNLKVIDFGIAREYKADKLLDTKVLGTPGYASPEQHGSRQTDERSDIYSLGMTMHHLLTGIDPRTDDYMYIPVRQWNTDLSEGIEIIIDKCTALDPQDRYQNCDELMYDLQHSEELGQGIKEKKKKRLLTFLISIGLSVVMLGVGIVGQVIAEGKKNASYETMVSEMTNAYSYEEKVDTYLEAIKLDGTKTDAYEKLLKAYEDNGKFTEQQSGEFRNVYEKNKENIAKNTNEEIEAYLNLTYKSGMLHFYMYSDNEGNMNFRTGLLKSEPFFREIANFSKEGYEVKEYEYYKIAESYVAIADFFSNYMDNSSGIKEPTKEDYDVLLSSFQTCIDNVDGFNVTDAYNKLLMYEQIANLLNNNSLSLAQTGVEEEIVVTLLEEVKSKTKSLGVTQQKSVELQETILENADIYMENIQRRYTNMNTKTNNPKESEETTSE